MKRPELGPDKGTRGQMDRQVQMYEQEDRQMAISLKSHAERRESLIKPEPARGKTFLLEGDLQLVRPLSLETMMGRTTPARNA